MTLNLLSQQLNDLVKLLQRLNHYSYTKKSKMLGEATLGQHVRHIIELIDCMVQGYDRGTINYDARKRDLRIENDIDFANMQIETLIGNLNFPDKSLLLIHGEQTFIHTFYYREVIYNTEHAIHHMALIRVALREMQLEIVDENFGVAPSTIQYRKNTYA